MLKFRYLFSNPDLALMLLKNWKYDPDTDELFKYFRISANAIYPVHINGKVCFLRFSPVLEKSEESVQAELEFLNYLHSQGYPAMQSVESKSGEKLVRKQTPWGEYLACVFKRVPGKQISQTDFIPDSMYAYGVALGELHALSKKYGQLTQKRWSHLDVYDWIEKSLSAPGLDQRPIQELALLRREFASIPMDQDHYGLIHFDFEPDNVFYDEGIQGCSVIDFDDAMYHWYVMDIIQVLDAIKDETEKDDISSLEAQFLDGYRSVFMLDEELIARKQLFRRFANLYQFTRVSIAMQERWENEPDWMVDLRGKLNRLLVEIEKDFGEF